MRTIWKLICILCILVLNGCIEKAGYYDHRQQSVINDLTNKSWERDFRVDRSDGFKVHETWVFKNDGAGYCKIVDTYDNGKQEERISYFRWTFTTPDFSVIYMDYGLFWEINKLVPQNLHIYETYNDPVTVPGQSYRDYKEFKAFPLSK